MRIGSSLRRGGGAALIMTAAVGAASKGVAQPHSLPTCGYYAPVLGTNANITFNVNADMLPEAQAASAFAMQNWANATVLSATQTSSQPELVFHAENFAGANVAGEMRVVNTTNGGCTYVGTKAVINGGHFGGGAGQVGVSVGEKGCIAAHEAGHAFGLAHSNIAGHTDGPPGQHAENTTIMFGQRHNVRCHNGSPPGGPRSADVTDIGLKY